MLQTTVVKITSFATVFFNISISSMTCYLCQSEVPAGWVGSELACDSSVAYVQLQRK